MTKRNYSNVAPPLPLSVAVTNAATTLTVTSTTGYPAAPFILSADRGTANEEVMLCTAKAGTTFTVTRGYDGTTAVAHAIGAMIEHTVAAIDYRESANTPMTTAERDALSGADLWNGMVISNTTTGDIERYNGSTWDSIATLGDITTGITGKADKTTTMTAGSGLTGGGDLSANRTFAVNFTTSGGSNGTATTVPRSDDARFSDARTPLSHSHAQSDIVGLSTTLAGKADTANPTFSGTMTLGTADGDTVIRRGLEVETDSRSLTVTYTGGLVSTLVEKNNTTTVKTTTVNWASGRVDTVVVAAGGKTATTTMIYDGSGNFTGYTRSVV